jgi:hypothetical protein
MCVCVCAYPCITLLPDSQLPSRPSSLVPRVPQNLNERETIDDLLVLSIIINLLLCLAACLYTSWCLGRVSLMTAFQLCICVTGIVFAMLSTTQETGEKGKVFNWLICSLGWLIWFSGAMARIFVGNCCSFDGSD